MRQSQQGVPDEVEQGVRGGHDGARAAVVSGLLLRAGPRVNDEHQGDTHDDGDEGGPEVVGDGQDPQPPAGLGVHGGQAGHEATGAGRSGG